MFLNYQPHLYERERRREREERSAKLEAILDNSSISSPNRNRRQSVDSAATSNDSASRHSISRTSGRRSSLTPSSSDYSSNKHDVSVTELTTHSSSLHSGGLFHRFHLRRHKPSGQDKSLLHKSNPENEPEKTTSIPSRSGERKSASSNKKERPGQSSTRWGSRDTITQTHSPTVIDNDSTTDEDLGKIAGHDLSPSPSTSSSHSHFGFTKKAMQRPKMGKRPATSSDRTSLRAEKGMFQRISASRSEQDLLKPTSGEIGRSDLSVNFDDQDSQEILTSYEPVYNEKATNGLRISISSDTITTDNHGFDSTADLSEYPLPVRLGVISASAYIHGECPDLLPASARSSFDFFNSKRSKSPSHHSNSASASNEHQYIDGYYLCTPPPRRAGKKAVRRVLTGAMATTPPSPTQSRPPRQRTISSSHSISGQSIVVSPINASPSPGVYRNGPFMIAQNLSTNTEKFNVATPTIASQAEDRQRWRLEDYFDVESNRRPGKFGFSQSKRHAYPSEEAPYPLAYGNGTLVAESLIKAHTEKTFGDFYLSSDRQPKRVLDIGCGDGQWILHMAQKWPEAEFIGMDLVPIQMPVKFLEKDIQKRISWVVGNALQGLPFPDQCFDLIHIRFLNYGIPKQKWPALLEDVNRVLSPAGELCILETDINFFGPVKRILKSDLSNLESQDGSTSFQFVDTEPNTHRNRDQRNSALEAVWQRTLERNGIGLNPISFLPGFLANVKDVQKIDHLGPKHMPILARSYSKKDKKETDIGYFDGPPRSSNLEDTPTVKGEARDCLSDLDVWRAVILAAETDRIADAKFSLWHEVVILRKEEERLKDEEANQSPRESFTSSVSPSLMSNSASNPFEQIKQADFHLSPDLSKSFQTDASSDVIGKALSDRWRDYAHFESEIDQWQAEMHAKADIEQSLKIQIPWSTAAENFDGWHSRESYRHKRDHQQSTIQDGQEELPKEFFFNGIESVIGSEGNNSPSPLSSDSPSQVLSESSSGRSSDPTSPTDGVAWQPYRSFASDIEQELAMEELEASRLANDDQQEKTIKSIIVTNDIETPILDTPTITSPSSARFASILGIKTVLLTTVRKDDNGGLDMISSF